MSMAARSQSQRWLRLGLLLLTLVGSIDGCAFSFGAFSFGYSQGPSKEEKAHWGTQPGRRVLSNWFFVEVSKPTSSHAPRATFYVIENPTIEVSAQGFPTVGGSANELGSQYVFWPEADAKHHKHGEGPPRCAFGVSEDGQSLLYFVEPTAPPHGPHDSWHPDRYAAALHFYRVGWGDTVIVQDVDHQVVYDEEIDQVPDDGVIYRVPIMHVIDDPSSWTPGQTVILACQDVLAALPPLKP
jgi:hypothetical protein